MDTTTAGDLVVTGRLHIAVAFDWGEGVDLARAAARVPARTSELPRRRRTPDAMAYRPAPLRFELGSVPLPSPELTSPADVEVTLFDFGAASVGLRIPFALPLSKLANVAATMGQAPWLVPLARAQAEPVFEQLKDAIDDRAWSELHEEYVIFQLDPHPELCRDGRLNPARIRPLVTLLRLDDAALSESEVQDALRCQISYGPDDAVLIDWPAAIVIDRDCEETLHTIEFANLQLLEYRYLDRKVDDVVAAARRQITAAAASWLRFWRTHSRPLRMLTQMRMDAVGTFERASTTLQLVGDQYLAKLYRLMWDRFHLADWAENVRQGLDVTESVHQTLSGQSAMYRLEFLEILVVLLIVFEILMAMVRTGG